MLEIKNVTKGYQNQLFVDISYTFEEGKTYLIQGENGSGKSALLNMLVGFSKPDSGKIYVDGKELYVEIDFLPNAGVVINNGDFISNLSGYDNLKLLLNIRKKVAVSEIDNYANYFKLEISKKPYKKYSQGMKQKLRLIQAFIEDPKYIILDEPSNALDAKAIEVLYTKCEYIKKDSTKTLIIVSHLNDKIASLADIRLKVENTQLVEVVD